MCRSPLHWRFWLPRGAYAPRSCLASADACRRGKQFLRCTNAHQQRAAGVSPPWVSEFVCADTSAIVRGTADGVCAGRRCIGVSGYHGGLTPPALVLRVRTLAGEKNNFCDAQTHISKERRSSARRGLTHRSCNGVRFRRERCSSARRGSGKLDKALWRSRGRLPAVS